MTFSFEDAKKATLEYFNNDEIAADVFIKKYALKDADGNLLEDTPDAMHKRLAKEFARIEKKYDNPMSEEEIYELFKDFKWIVPQGSPMSAIGNTYKVQSSSNCFVVQSPMDSYGGVCYTDQQEVQIAKRRGGIGFDISTLRPRGTATANAAGTSDGIEVFMERYSNSCREVAQSGRRGALLLSLSVHHPDIETFIKIKRDLTKVTGANISIRLTDEFMNAVKKNKDVELRFPVESDAEHIVKRKVSAKHLWDEIIKSARDSAEPGLLFWDNVIKNTPADCYSDVGYGSVSTNPCLSGDTLIAVADGRGTVPIRDLAEQGKDVAVYSVNPNNGMIEIKTGRNPRKTGSNKKLLRIHLDDGSYVDTTKDHNFLLKNNSKIEAKDLKPGDSLSRFDKEILSINKKSNSNKYCRVRCNTNDIQKDKVFEHRLIAQFNNPELWQEKYDKEKKNGWVDGGLVVHHKDYNGLNNSPDNLEIMSFKEHQEYHAKNDCSGESNGRFMGSNSKQIKEHALSLTKNLGRKFSFNEWYNYAEKNNLPKSFSKMHHNLLGKSPHHLAEKCAIELGYFVGDPRVARTLDEAISQGYDSKIKYNKVFVSKQCEGCNCNFDVSFYQREISFCSHECYLIKHNKNTDMHEKRVQQSIQTHRSKMHEIMMQQSKIWSDLKFTLKKTPTLKEWEGECKKNNISFRLNTKYGFKNYKEVCEISEGYNHRVVKIEELPGLHSVYNITVDDNHTVSLITKIGAKSYSGINVFQCGEICLSPYDSCRLMVLNLFSFVKDPFTNDACFDYKSFKEKTIKAQRLMDDMIDLELECIDKIISKIKSDPEPDSIKQIEKDLWENIKETCKNGRRTGLGITALGDALAALGIVYGSSKSIKVTEEIYKHLAIHAYESTVTMAKERGAFPVYDYNKEKNHEFINRIINESDFLKENYKKYGRRNIALTTTAPTGSVSIMTQTTSGIEPAFMLGYTRRRKINPDDKGVKVDFVDDLGDRWQEYKVYHHKYKMWMDVSGKEKEEESPYYKGLANDIDWVSSVKLQAAAQRWICHAISRTCNLPNDVSYETVSDIYMEAWKSGCKGFTVYRDGCRSGVLVSNTENNTSPKFKENKAPKRPEQLPCDIHHVNIKGEAWTILIGLMDNRPYEIFGGLSSTIEIPKKHKKGLLIKHPRKSVVSVYDLRIGENDDIFTIKNVVKVFDNPTEGAFTRTISLALRHGAPIQFLAEQLQKDDKDSDMFSFSRVIARVLKQYILDGTKASVECPECGSDQVMYTEGCLTCPSCGFGKCG